MSTLSDKVVLVTGSSTGIGKAVAVALAREGAHIALNIHMRHRHKMPNRAGG